MNLVEVIGNTVVRSWVMEERLAQSDLPHKGAARRGALHPLGPELVPPCRKGSTNLRSTRPSYRVTTRSYPRNRRPRSYSCATVNQL